MPGTHCCGKPSTFIDNGGRFGESKGVARTDIAITRAGKWAHILTFDITPLGGRCSWHHCPKDGKSSASGNCLRLSTLRFGSPYPLRPASFASATSLPPIGEQTCVLESHGSSQFDNWQNVELL